MSNVKLPPVIEDKQLLLPHFPSRLHAAVFRLWETVKAERIAYALDLPLEKIIETANELGLSEQKNMDIWSERGYITTIRNAWHVLPYEQLLKVLDWTDEQLANCLKDDDFLDIKLGGWTPFKAYCEPVTAEDLNDEQKAQLEKIRKIMKSDFSDMFSGSKPFEFFSENEKAVTPANDADGLRMIFSYCGLYATVLDNDISTSYPEALMQKYQAAGVNAVWLPVVLYQVTEFPFDASYSVGYEKRQERLRELVKLAAQYGIKIYLYLNEPRNMPITFFDKHPELLGRKNDLYGALCTSDSRVLEYVKNSVTALCKAVPGLGGFVTITQSENLTHCKSRPEGEECPRCKDKPVLKLISEVLCAISEASRAVDPSIKTIAWTWAWTSAMNNDEIRECIASLPEEIIVQCNSEAQKPFTIGGVNGNIEDYSMSIPGPGELAKSVWSLARDLGRETCAKVQVNVTWECSTIPYLPVFDLIREHMCGLKAEGVRHLMLSWTLGGYPSVNLKVASQCLVDPSEKKYDELLKSEYGEYAETVKKAAKIFSDAFREFPFHLDSVYHGPQNAGPSNLLFEKPTGFTATMTGYSYDDIDTWRANYPREVYLNQYKKLSDKWREGLELIKNMPECEFTQAAWAGYALFYSSYLQSEFILSRDGGDKEKLAKILSEERDLAFKMYQLMNKNSLIGYEAANHYYFNKGMMAEKVICCEYLKDKLC
ncbi:MAG: hypothetical protein II978_07720 [Clostridia bacterium]|nr:hypothetical protein [Clostridia bacterium]